MISDKLYASPDSPPHKTAQHSEVSPAQKSNGTVLAENLRTLETEFERRGFLKRSPEDLFNPLWYLAETERSIFLWKRGCSVIEQDDFEFWINVPALIRKRLAQLANYDAQNPFLNPLWGVVTSSDSINSERERQYLESFLDAIHRIHLQLSALSEVGSLLLHEQKGSTRERVVLPQGSTI